jgi:hypothetical protein
MRRLYPFASALRFAVSLRFTSCVVMESPTKLHKRKEKIRLRYSPVDKKLLFFN